MSSDIGLFISVNADLQYLFDSWPKGDLQMVRYGGIA